jgi:hypothetical protein
MLPVEHLRELDVGCWMLDVEGKKSSRPASIPSDTDRLKVYATGAASALNTYQGEGTARA